MAKRKARRPREDGPHPTVPVWCEWENREIDIDVDLAPLIRLLWEMDIRTAFSCQEEVPGEASINFDNVNDAAHFLTCAGQPYIVEATRAYTHGPNPRYLVWLKVWFPTVHIPYLVEDFEAVLQIMKETTPTEVDRG